MKRHLFLLVMLVTMCACAWAQQGMPAATQAAPAASPGIAAETKQAYTQIKNNFLRAAEKMPEENYSFKPVPEIRAFGELIAHVADTQARSCSTLNGAPKKLDAASKKTKTELVAALKESFDECDKAYDSLTDANATQAAGRRSRLGTLTYNTTHDNESYGYMCVYMRLKGIVPPSSEPRQ